MSNQKLEVSSTGASDWWRESARKSVSFYQDKIRGSAILWCVSQKWDMRVFSRTDKSLHGGRRGRVR